MKKNGKQSNCSLVDEWTRKLVYSYNGIQIQFPAYLCISRIQEWFLVLKGCFLKENSRIFYRDMQNLKYLLFEPL